MDTDLVQVVIIGVDGTPATRYNSHQTTRLVCQSRKRNPTPETNMARFTRDNTDGSYNTAELAELNRRFDAAMAAEGPLADDILKSHENNIAEIMQAEFDASPAGWRYV